MDDGWPGRSVGGFQCATPQEAHKHCGRFDHLSAHLLGSRLALTHEEQCHGDAMFVEVEEAGFLES